MAEVLIERTIRRLVIAELRNAYGDQKIAVVANTLLGVNWQTVVFNVTLALSDYDLGELPVASFNHLTTVQELVRSIINCQYVDNPPSLVRLNPALLN